MTKLKLAVLGMAVVLAACSEAAGPGAGPTVSLTFASGAAGSSLPAPVGAAGETFVSGSDVLVVNRAQIVLREIELKRQDDDLCEAGEGDDDGCEEFETGPMLVDLPLGGQAATMITIEADTGTYDEIDFEVHKTEGTEDAAFIAQHPEFDGQSIRVEGTWNDAPFTFTSDLDVEQENALVPPLVITQTTGTNVTLRVDVATWFRNGSGALVNPASGNKGGANESLVKENIKVSFHAFEDHDRDGDDSDER